MEDTSQAERADIKTRWKKPSHAAALDDCFGRPESQREALLASMVMYRRNPHTGSLMTQEGRVLSPQEEEQLLYPNCRTSFRTWRRTAVLQCQT
jgi:hypothetical protein